MQQIIKIYQNTGGLFLDILDQTESWIDSTIYNRYIIDRYPDSYKVFKMHYNGNDRLFQSALSDYNKVCFASVLSSRYLRRNGVLRDFDLNDIICDTIIPQIVCNYFDKKTHYDTFEHRYDHMELLRKLFSNCYRFCVFIKLSFPAGYALYYRGVLLCRAREASTILQNKYDLPDDVLHYIISFVV